MQAVEILISRALDEQKRILNKLWEFVEGVKKARVMKSWETGAVIEAYYWQEQAEDLLKLKGAPSGQPRT